MDDIRVGLFGLGHRGLGWLRLIQTIPGFRITAIGDLIPALHERGRAQLHDGAGVPAYAEYEDMLADPNVDAIALVVRAERQGGMAAQALEAGKHVNAEVPAAHTMEDCWRIVVAAERTGLVYHLAEQSRYAGMFTAWKGLVHQGALGKITYVEGEYVGYKGDHRYYQDWKTGELLTPEEGKQRPDAKPTWMLCPSIHYLPHELSPLLMILDDRIARVTGMGTRVPSYNHPEVEKADIQVALMQTDKDTILRLMCGYTIPTPPARDHHHYQIIGTRGHLESGRTSRDMAKMWLADSHMHDMADVDWRWQRTDASDEILASGHRGTDYYVHTAFRDAVWGDRPLEFDVYKAIETAAPAILAADSIDQGSIPIDVPDFRPNETRPHGQMPVQ